LALTYFQLGEFDKALENAKDAIRVDPDEGRGYLWSAVAYAGLNRPSEAAAIARAGLQHNPELLGLHDELAYIAFIQGDLATMEKEEALERGSYIELRATSRHGDIAASRGQIRQAQDFYGKARQIAQRLELKEREADAVNEQAWVLALAGYRKLAIENADVASRIPQNFGTKLRLASALALAGESKRAMDVAAEVAKSRPEDTLVKAVDVPLVQAIAALNNGKAFEAIEILKAASPYDKANTRVLYVRGLAFLKARQGNDAAQEFQKVLSLRNFAADDPVLSMAHLGLARARAMSGDAASARTAYQDFFALWKDADPDIPILREAKAEYAKLR
jgi:tetratricopeptide (TPR) repeat protein